MRSLFSFLILMIVYHSTYAQFRKVEIKPGIANTKQIKINPIRSPIKQIPLTQEIVGLPATSDKESIDTNFEPNSTFKKRTPEVIRKTKEKLNDLQDFYPDESNSNRTLSPNIGTNFEGNLFGSMRPPDNNIAISNNGYIVSVTNSRINYYTSSGTQLYSSSFAGFFNQYSYMLYDPKILFDSQSNRFIMVVLEGNTPSHTIVKLCFSKSNIPSSGWWVYSLDGDITSNGYWFDYPNIGVSTNEVFISGNLFNSSNNFQTAGLYQLDKSDGFSGNTMNWISWWNLANNPFTIVPASYGQTGNYGPGIYMICSDENGIFTDKYRLYNITDDIGNSPQILAYSVNGSISACGDAPQNGTSVLLDNGYNRVRSAFYLNGIIHFVLGSEYNSTNYNGLQYNRLTVSGLSNTRMEFGWNGYDYSYPSVASYGSTASDKSVMISFLRSGSNIYPETRVVHCDNSGGWSSSVQVKSGETYISVAPSGGVERWGDYSGIVRKPSTSPEVWLTGCYGKFVGSTHAYGTWIAQVTDAIPDEITVSYPNGGENWQQGTQHTITWSDNINENVKIQLYKGSSLNLTISSSTSSDGSYIWTVPSGQTPGTDYRVKITSTTNSSVYDYSDNYFTISATPINCVDCPSYDLSLSPTTSWLTHSSSHVSNGCKMYRITMNAGNIYTFKTGCGDGATADYDTFLELYNSSCTLLTSNDDGCESTRSKIEWTATYTGYAYLKVRGYSSYYGNYALAYKRAVPNITVTDPNGGENWQQGTQYTIAWSDNISENVKIQLYKGSSLNLTISSSTSSDGSYIWTVPSGQTPGADYRVKITSTTNSNVYDYSNNYFIVSAQTPVNNTVQNETINNRQTKCYDATNTITVAGSGTTVDVMSGGTAIFISGGNILIKPGFHSHSGSSTHAYITITSDYCSSLPPLIATPEETVAEEAMKNPELYVADESNINIYPNPTRGNFTIDFMGKITTAEILLLNFQGKQIMEHQCKEQLKKEINISNLPTGMYIVLIKTKERMITKKIIKNY